METLKSNVLKLINDDDGLYIILLDLTNFNDKENEVAIENYQKRK